MPATVTRCPCSQSGIGNDIPLLLRKTPGRGLQGLGDGGQPFVEDEIPHQQLQQDRDIAEQLHVAGAEAPHEEVAGQPADADQRAQDRREHDADDGRTQRIREPDQERLPVGIGRVECEDALADVEAGRLREEAEAALDSAHAHVLERVVREERDDGGDRHHRHRLVDQAACRPAAPGPVAFLGMHAPDAGAVSGLAVRTGARPCSRDC